MFSRLGQVARHLSRPISSGQAQRSFLPASPNAIGVVMDASSRSAATPDERQRRKIHTAACIIIGDEVLGGKTVDTNSAYMAKWCFSLGMQMKRIVVIADDETEIIETVREFSNKYDLVATSGGIGPTHDDITYQSIAKAFDLPLVLHDAAFARMKRISPKHRMQPDFSWDVPSPELEAKKRMIVLPRDEGRADADQVVFPCENLWVPVSVVNGNVHILPGVPRLFEQLIDGLRPSLLPRLTDPEGRGIHRITISTPLPESAVAGYLTALSARTEPRGVKVGSYPRWNRSTNSVTLVGKDVEYMESLVREVEEGVRGMRVGPEGEDDKSDDEKAKDGKSG